MAHTFEKTCDIPQGLNFKQDEHTPFGFITRLTIGSEGIPADIAVADPMKQSSQATKTNAGTGFTADTSGKLQKKVVAVLNKAAWDYTPTGMIEFGGIVSLFNMNRLASIAIMQGKGIGVHVEFIVYDYDGAASSFYPAFFSMKGEAPMSGKPADATKASNTKGDDKAQPVYAMVGKDGNVFGITVEGPNDASGQMLSYGVTLKLAPPRATKNQQVVIQTSLSHKLVLPWGLPQFAGQGK